MQATVTRVTAVDAAAAYAWWTDYAEHDHAGHGFRRYGSMTRRVIWFDAEKGAEMVDEGKAIGIPVSFRSVASFSPGERVSVRTEGFVSVLEREYWFEPLAGGGARVTARAVYHEHPVARRIAPLTDAALHAALAHDLKAHLAECESDLGAAAGQTDASAPARSGDAATDDSAPR